MKKKTPPRNGHKQSKRQEQGDVFALRDICSDGICLYKNGDLFLVSVKIGTICIWDYSLIRNLMPLLQTSEKKK